MQLQKLPYTNEKLQSLVQFCLDEANKQGATSAEASVNIENGLSVTARLGEVETLEHHNDHGLAVTVYVNHKKGASSTTNLELDSLKDAVTAACNIAKFTQDDSCLGLADKNRMADVIQDLRLDHPWDLSPEYALSIAIECENNARKHKEITNSEGATVNTSRSTTMYANSHGFMGGYSSTRHGLSCIVIAEKDKLMQRDYWFTASRQPEKLDSPASVGELAATRTIKRLGAKKIPTQTTPVIYEANMTRSLLSHFISAISGSALYRKASFLLDQIDQKVFSPIVNIVDDPHILGGLGSSPFDLEGVATKKNKIVEGGILQSYILSSYSARRLKLQSTGNAGGIHNLILEPGSQSLNELITEMNRGLLVTELIGHGVNIVTGDYSRGAVGYWIENGEIQFPVEEITIAGNLKDIFKKIVAIGNDVDGRSSIITPSLLVDELMVAGS